jgi:hypothetical protein
MEEIMNEGNSNTASTADHAKQLTNPKVGLVFILIINIQFYLLPVLPQVFGVDLSKFAEYTHLYALISYTLIVFGIVIFHANGLTLFSDYSTLLLILLSLFIRSSLGGEYELLHRIYMAILGVILLAFIVQNRTSLRKTSPRVLVIGIVWAFGTVLGLAILRALLVSDHGSLPANLSAYIRSALVFQFSFVAVIEEACFRGLIFGFLIMNGVKENIALLIQGVLFLGIHYMKVGDPVLFFLIIPLYTISASLLVRKYKILTPAIVMHVLNNVFAGVIIAIL